MPTGERKVLVDAFRKAPHVTRVEYAQDMVDFAARNLQPMEAELLALDFKRTPAYDRYFAKRTSQERVFVYMDNTSLKPIQETRAAILKACRGHCQLLGDLENHAAFSSKVISTLLESFFLSLVLVAIILVSLGWASGVGQPVKLVFSSMWGPVVLLGSVPLLLGGVNFVTCVFAAMLVGLAGDNAIQFLFAAQNNSLESGMDERMDGSLQLTVIFVCSSLVFLGSTFQQPKILGILFALGYLVLFVGDCWVLRGLQGPQSRKETP
jgi:hypothetical protein